jgi:hypothetical protein
MKKDFRVMRNSIFINESIEFYDSNADGIIKIFGDFCFIRDCSFYKIKIYNDANMDFNGYDIKYKYIKNIHFKKQKERSDSYKDALSKYIKVKK